LVDDDFVLWESNSILRYLAMQYGVESSIYPVSARQRAGVDRWLDWSLSRLQPAERPVFWGYVRTAPKDRDEEALKEAVSNVEALWILLDSQLQGRVFLEAESFTLADLVLSTYARRWFGLEGLARRSLPNLERWYQRIEVRPGFLKYLAPALT
jgi:glutathione S-transferase